MHVRTLLTCKSLHRLECSGTIYNRVSHDRGLEGIMQVGGRSTKNRSTESHLVPNLSTKGFKEVKILFQEIGVDPLVYEIDQDPEGREMERALTRLGCNAPVPAVFIGGKLMGSTNEVMSLHLSGSLIPMLKPYQN
ncbi:hypothetical protein H0E87_005372 [Populus deltoides]|uniref:Glutaredoxin domain-containing protein n=1 Tax=Populus deltoides TaxID=3696 RepID=A0A8T2ZJ32_POPDE|nr:hypothetical protein H0E87_005372 [Populus deltoides]